MNFPLFSPALFLIAISSTIVNPTSLSAQTSEKKVAAVDVTCSDKLKLMDIDETCRDIKTALVKSERFRIVDRKDRDRVKSERSIQKGEEFIKSKTVKQARSLGAELLIVAHVLAIDRNNPSKLPNPIIHLYVVNVITEQVLASEIISKTGRKVLSISSMSERVNDNLKKIYGSGWNNSHIETLASIGETFEMVKLNSPQALIEQIYSFLNTYFPAGLKIFKLDEVKGTRVKSFMIKTNDKSIRKGQRLEVIEEIMEKGIDGSTARVERIVAEARISGSAGEVLICSVSSGAEDLYYKYAKANVFIRMKR